MSVTQILKIARREYLARVRSRAFIFMTVMIPAFLGAYMFVLLALFSSSGGDDLRVALLDTGTGLTDALADHLANINRPTVEVTERVVVPDDSDTARARFSEAVRQETLDGYVLLRKNPDIVARASYYARETGNPALLRELELAVESTVLDELLVDTEVDVEQIRALQRSDLDTVTVSDEGEEEGGFETAFASTLGLGMLLYMSVIINGQGMAMAIVEEKSSRLIEVILGAVTATEFMTGKILGVLGSGLTQLAVWVGVTLVGLLYVLLTMSIGAELAGFDLSAALSLELIFYFSIFFALGYFLYSVFFAAVAATCTSTEELGQAMFAAMLPLIVAFLSTFYVLTNPSTVATRVLSLLPPFTPLVMLARVNVLTPPLWEVWLGIALLVLGIVVAGWLAAKIFRYALLMHGKRPTLPDLLSVMRAT
ncbi:MAG: ABC transporter permease [Vicinamibacterales bacterium]|jgi:ABC-2 type transport system permease protein|nr:ABC transporter permease [Vicinamibacterales bacterium]